MSGGFELPHQTSKRKKQGFGGGKAKKPPQQGKTFTTGEAVARHMLLEYNAIKADGGKVARVHARLKGTDEWFPVGNVSSNNEQQLLEEGGGIGSVPLGDRSSSGSIHR